MIIFAAQKLTFSLSDKFCRRCGDVLYLSEVVQDVEAALRDGDVHGVFGADVDGCARFWKNDKIIPVDGTLVLDRVVLHLKEWGQKVKDFSSNFFSPESSSWIRILIVQTNSISIFKPTHLNVIIIHIIIFDCFVGLLWHLCVLKTLPHTILCFFPHEVSDLNQWLTDLPQAPGSTCVCRCRLVQSEAPTLHGSH